MSETPFKEHVVRVSTAQDRLSERVTEVECEYVKHRGDGHAVMIIRVDNGCCPEADRVKNSEVRLCWDCVLRSGYRDAYHCACRTENSVHKSHALTFVGEIKPAKVDA